VWPLQLQGVDRPVSVGGDKTALCSDAGDTSLSAGVVDDGRLQSTVSLPR